MVNFALRKIYRYESLSPVTVNTAYRMINVRSVCFGCRPSEVRAPGRRTALLGVRRPRVRSIRSNRFLDWPACGIESAKQPMCSLCALKAGRRVAAARTPPLGSLPLPDLDQARELLCIATAAIRCQECERRRRPRGT